MSRIHLSPPDVGPLEEQYVVDAVRSGWVAPLGPHVDGFEREMAERIGTEHAVALSTGTDALHLVLAAWGIGAGEFVPTSTFTFVATANAITYTGATPVFVDSDPVTGNIDPHLLDETVTRLRAEGKKVSTVVPVDLLGRCADYSAIGKVAAEHGVRVLADSAESLGARAGDVPAGAFGDAAVLSFNGNKIITTSGGGMVTTNDAALAQRLRFLSTQAREPEVHYEHRELGYNHRMSNVLAGLGRAQLSRLDGMLVRLREIREAYAALFEQVDGVTIFQRQGDEHDNCWLTAILVDESITGWSPGDLCKALEDHDIESRPLWKPMHLQPLYADHPQTTTGAAESFFNRGLALPSGSGLSTGELDRITAAISDFVGK